MIIRRFSVALLVIIVLSGAMAQVGLAAARVRVSEGFMQTLLLKKVDPVYPSVAREDRIEGSVVLQVNISKSGDVENIQQVSGHPMLAPAAVHAVKQWKYAPYKLNGEPVAVQTKVSVNFSLSNKPTPQGIAGDQPGGIPPGDLGKRLAYISDRKGTMEIWISNRDGSNAFQLTAVGGAGTPRWSPNSQEQSQAMLVDNFR